jgi:hypothetical protein
MKVRLVHYNEVEQYCGGWVDMGIDFTYKNYSTDELDKVWKNCHSAERCFVQWDGKIYRCAFAAAGTLMGKIPKLDGDSVNILDHYLSVDELRNGITLMQSRAVEGCKYCNGFDVVNGKRVPAGEQLEG